MKIKGYASRTSVDRVGHVVAAYAFKDSIAARGLTGSRGVKLLYGHNSDKILGSIAKLTHLPNGLWIEAEIDKSISYAADVAKAIAASGGLSFSVSFIPSEVDLVSDKNGDEYLKIVKGDLYEVSVVPFPCNEDCEMSYEN